MTTPRFANILLAGACNLRCPRCIGKLLGTAGEPNLGRFPLAGQAAFIARLRSSGTRQVSLTGANTDPMLYQHQRALLEVLRREVSGVKISLHTNGILALRHMELFNSYDRATISVPSFEAGACEAMTGSARVLDLERIAARARIPIKISTLVTRHNRAEVPEILRRCAELGIARLVLRTPYGERRDPSLLAGRRPLRSFAGNPVYLVHGMEVTLWDFSLTSLDCFNLHSDGRISQHYLLAADHTARRQGEAHAV